MRLFINEVQRTVASFSIPAFGQTEESLTWTIQNEGIQQGRIEIVDYPVIFDDQLFFSYEVASGIPVLSIDEQGQGNFLRALFGRDTTFFYNSMPAFAVDFSAFPRYNLVVLNGLNAISPGLAMEAQRYVEQGGHRLAHRCLHLRAALRLRISACLALGHRKLFPAHRAI
ncbi:MAG: hypothetical protein K0B09_15185 [Bacteroidales bacterium]|nr:hypothetical protein [Bacteroidales bacterium]